MELGCVNVGGVNGLGLDPQKTCPRHNPGTCITSYMY